MSAPYCSTVRPKWWALEVGKVFPQLVRRRGITIRDGRRRSTRGGQRVRDAIRGPVVVPPLPVRGGATGGGHHAGTTGTARRSLSQQSRHDPRPFCLLLAHGLPPRPRESARRPPAVPA